MILDDTVGFGVFAILRNVPRMGGSGLVVCRSRWLDGFVVISLNPWQCRLIPFIQV